MNRARLSPLLALPLFLLGSCATLGIYPADPLAERRAELRREAGALTGEPDDAALDGELMTRYRAKLAALDKDARFGGSLEFGTVPWSGGTLGVILLQPPAGVPIRGVIIAYHGYMSYSVFNLPALETLAEAGWTVLAADLPGHGFSDGKSGWIGSFHDYADATRGLLAWLEPRDGLFPGPRVILGHSGGSAAAIESLLSLSGELDAGILLAPLIRPEKFGSAWLASVALAPFVSAVPPEGAEEGFLGASYLPLSWVRRLGAWSDGLARREPLPGVPVLAVWGDRDAVIDLELAGRTLPRLFPDWERAVVAGGGHVIFDNRRTQEEALAAIVLFLDRKFPVVGGMDESGR